VSWKRKNRSPWWSTTEKENRKALRKLNKKERGDNNPKERKKEKRVGQGRKETEKP
jgi:hypothetical protein